MLDAGSVVTMVSVSTMVHRSLVAPVMLPHGRVEVYVNPVMLLAGKVEVYVSPVTLEAGRVVTMVSTSAEHTTLRPESVMVTLVTLSVPGHTTEPRRFVMLAIGNDVVWPSPVSSEEQTIDNPDSVSVTLVTLSVPVQTSESMRLVMFEIGRIVVYVSPVMLVAGKVEV